MKGMSSEHGVSCGPFIVFLFLKLDTLKEATIYVYFGN